MSSYKRKLDLSNNNSNIVSKKSKGAQPIKISNGYVSNTELYARTLCNPMSELKAKIPDLACINTSVFSISETFDWDPSFTASAGSLTHVNYLGIKIGSGTSDQAELLGPAIYQSCDATGIDNNPLFAVSGVAGYPYQRYIKGFDRIKTAYTSARIVSVGVQLEFTGPDTLNAGTIDCCVVQNTDALYGDGFTGVPPAGEWATVNLGSLTTTQAFTQANGISTEMIINARESFQGPAKYGAFFAWRPREPAQFFAPVRQSTSPPTTSNSFSEMLIVKASTQNDGEITSAAVVKYRVKITATYEGTIKDSTYPRPPTHPSPMDVYGLQCSVEAALATSRLGSLSNGPDATWKQLENTGLNKFHQVVSMSQGR